MNRILLAGVLAVTLAGSANAQTAPSGNATTGNSVTLAKPPSGTAPPSTRRPRTNTNLLTNTPLTPQIALRPTATVGSSVPIAGAGGSVQRSSN